MCDRSEGRGAGVDGDAREGTALQFVIGRTSPSLFPTPQPANSLLSASSPPAAAAGAGAPGAAPSAAPWAGAAGVAGGAAGTAVGRPPLPAPPPTGAPRPPPPTMGPPPPPPRADRRRRPAPARARGDDGIWMEHPPPDPTAFCFFHAPVLLAFDVATLLCASNRSEKHARLPSPPALRFLFCTRRFFATRLFCAATAGLCFRPGPAHKAPH